MPESWIIMTVVKYHVFRKNIAISFIAIYLLYSIHVYYSVIIKCVDIDERKIIYYYSG